MKPELIEGGMYADERGVLLYNNSFNAAGVKRIYIIENKDTTFVRAWQGHKIEQRWFSAIEGSFEIKLIEIDNWEVPSANLKPFVFLLEAGKLNVLHIPPGYVSSIQAKSANAKLLVMADYMLGEITDEYRYDSNYF